MLDHEAVKVALDRMWPRLDAREFLHDLYGAKPLLRLALKSVLPDDAVDLLYRKRSDAFENIPWTAGDVALIDEARILLGPLRPLKEGEQHIAAYGHVVVDEAQDLSPMQLRMLGRRSLNGSMTLVGDIAQATGSWAPSNWDDVLRYLPMQWQKSQTELTIGYRTPAEAMKLAAPVLDETGLGLIPPRPVRSSGVEPVIDLVGRDQLAKELASRVAAEQAEGLSGTTGIICAHSIIDQVATALDDANITYGTAGKRALDSDITLLVAEVAKGLEFDSVFVVEPGELVTESAHGLRSLYVALTRTTLRLTLLHSEALPPYLHAAAEDNSEH